jgi:hypothetical protein
MPPRATSEKARLCGRPHHNDAHQTYKNIKIGPQHVQAQRTASIHPLDARVVEVAERAVKRREAAEAKHREPPRLDDEGLRRTNPPRLFASRIVAKKQLDNADFESQTIKNMTEGGGFDEGEHQKGYIS